MSGDTAQVACWPRLARTIEETCRTLTSGEGILPALSILSARLGETRRLVSSQEWFQLREELQRHQIAELLCQDPLTRSAFERTSGAASTLDLLEHVHVGHVAQRLLAAASPTGREINAFTSNLPTIRALRERPSVIAERIRLQRHAFGETLRVLAVGAGPLREADFAQVTCGAQIWTALDDDPVALRGIDHRYGAFVNIERGSLFDFVTGRLELVNQDVVYIGHAMDYLPHTSAVELVRRAARLLRERGFVVCAALTDRLDDAAYVEVFLDWPLVAKSEDEFVAIAEAITCPRFKIEEHCAGNLRSALIWPN